jgi:NAD(P)-dependent dehydrogenase (short-subunit alcohol dehydrogenase family)
MKKNNDWTLSDMPDLTGKIIIVTGGNSGLGFESAKVFAEEGALVVLACRSLESGEKAKTEILHQNRYAKIDVMPIDLTDLASVASFASQFKQKYNRLDVLLNNAGIMLVPYTLTKDGFESQLGVNHLAHFALTAQLIDLIIKTPKSRVVNVSSLAHESAIMNFDDLMYTNRKEYTPMKAYRRSKMANLLFTYELQRLFEKAGVDSIAVVAHPGVSRTKLMRHIEGKWILKGITPIVKMFIQTAAKGALCQIRAAADLNVKGGEYYGPNGFKEIKGYPVLVQSNELSHSEEAAKKLWEFSETVTNIPFKSLLFENSNRDV